MAVNDIRDKLKQKKIMEEEDLKKSISDGFLTSIQKLMFEFSKKVESKQIEVKDPNDLYKLFVIFSQMQNLTQEENTNGVLPQLSQGQQNIFDEFVDQVNDDEALVDLAKISEMSEEDITNIIMEKEKLMNTENSETF